ncbi:hypothetical protein SCUCBS95973_009260 [Sporothrix curviconia]|uniref:DUF6546 domain-containing protein n=1 Tax=Sporothrix curviconia TaxID=1260050 RepID=A0ABP0CV21_9PEZI
MLPDISDPNKQPSALFAANSVRFQHMAIAFLVHAEELFQHCRPTWTWPHLQSLALTSPLLRPDWDNSEPIEQLLGRAGVLARQMPRLHTLVLWNGARGHALCLDHVARNMVF